MFLEPNIEQLRENYKRLDDDKIIRLATEEAHKLRPEAQELLKKIMAERGLPAALLDGPDSQIKEIGEDVFTSYLDLIRNLPCPVCHSTNQKLKAIMLYKVVSYILRSNHTKKLHIGCSDCLLKQLKSDTTTSMLLGWWSLPMGMLRTFKALKFNTKMKKQLLEQQNNEILATFVLKSLGIIENNKDKPAQLEEIIKNPATIQLNPKVARL
ncbi:MAG: hypothetical protein H0X62_02155 [Bacteroidetes bacterium]|nr:hypothetical protein [Bacteroidota bacterium]